MSFLHSSNFEEQPTVSRNFPHSEVEKEHFCIIAYRHSVNIKSTVCRNRVGITKSGRDNTEMEIKR